MFYYSCFIDDKAGALRCFFIPLLVTDGLTINHLRQILDHQSSVAFSRRDLLGQKKKCADDACHKSFIVRRVGHTSSVLAPGLPKAKANQLHLLLHLQFLPFPSFSPLISQTCSSLRLHSLSPFSLHSLIPKWPPCIRQGGLGFAAVTIKYSMFCSNKSCFSFMLDVHQGHLWLCSL